MKRLRLALVVCGILMALVVSGYFGKQLYDDFQPKNTQTASENPFNPSFGLE